MPRTSAELLRGGPQAALTPSRARARTHTHTHTHVRTHTHVHTHTHRQTYPYEVWLGVWGGGGTKPGEYGRKILLPQPVPYRTGRLAGKLKKGKMVRALALSVS